MPKARSPWELLRGSDGHVGICWVQLDHPPGSVDAMRSRLSLDELRRSDAKRRPRDRDRAVVARAALKDVLGRVLGRPADRVTFEVSEHGKPHVVLEAGDPAIEFNLAHSDGWAVVAVGRGRRIGVDVERVRAVPEMDGVIERFFAKPERDELLDLPPPARRDAFFATWTRKEAVLKAMGTGITAGLDHVVVSVDPVSPARLLAAGAVEPVERWRLLDLRAPDGFRAALAVEGGGWEPLIEHWKPGHP